MPVGGMVLRLSVCLDSGCHLVCLLLCSTRLSLSVSVNRDKGCLCDMGFRLFVSVKYEVHIVSVLLSSSLYNMRLMLSSLNTGDVVLGDQCLSLLAKTVDDSSEHH